MRAGDVWVAVGAAVIAISTLTAPAFAATPVGGTVLFSETFSGQDTPAGDWIAKSTGGGTRPCLTAAAHATSGGIPECLAVEKGTAKPDPDGAGAFQITGNGRNDSGFGLYTRPKETARGLRIDFDIFQHSAHTFNDGKGKRGGDGIAFFLINGTESPRTAGGPGGGLGYRGLPGAVIGIGFDEFGNFSDPKIGGKGGRGVSPNSIV